MQTMFLRGRDWWVSLDAAPSSHGGCQEKNSTRRARGRRGDSLQLGHDPGGMHGEVDSAVSGGAGAATTALDGPAASGWAGASSAPLMFEGLDAKKSTEGEISFLFQPLFKRERDVLRRAGAPGACLRGSMPSDETSEKPARSICPTV